MLKGIDSRLSPELLGILAEMGHGDRLAIVDRNYPAYASDRPVVRLDALGLLETLDVVLSVFPVDTFVDEPVAAMNQVDTDEVPAVQLEAFAKIEAVEGRPIGVERLDRFEYYAAAKECYAVLANSEDRPYGCIILTKGVI